MQVLVEGEIGPRMAGPAIRGWEVARSLAERHTVTVVARNSKPRRIEGIEVLPWGRHDLLRRAPRFDAVLAPWLPPYLLWVLIGAPTLSVADLYDPADLELEVLGDGSPEARAVRELTDLQLRFADVLVCAGEAQRTAIARRLDALVGDSDRPPIEVVPFGLPRPPPAPRADDRPLRQQFPQIGADDTVVLWWGTPWRWLDAPTAVRAMRQLADRRSDVKLVITAGRPGPPDTERLLDTDSVRALARELGVLDRTVFFLEEWVAYEQRHRYLQEVDIGIALHRATDEAPVAARARYMDFLWTSLPCVLAHGDEVVDRMVDAGAAIAVPPGSVEATSAALLRLVDDLPTRRQAAAAAGVLAESYRWDAVVAPLSDRLSEEPWADKRQLHRRDAAPAIARYYAHRLSARLRRSATSVSPGLQRCLSRGAGAAHRRGTHRDR